MVYVCMCVCVYIYIYEILLNYKANGNYVICGKMDGTGDYHAKWDKPSSKGQI
jgi:hypothetical protein